LSKDLISRQRNHLNYALIIVLRTVDWLVWFMVFNTTFNNNSVVVWRSVLLVEETRVSGENHRPVASHWETLSHNVASNTPRHERGSNSQLYWWYELIAQIVVNPLTIRSRWPPLFFLLCIIENFKCMNIWMRLLYKLILDKGLIAETLKKEQKYWTFIILFSLYGKRIQQYTFFFNFVLKLAIKYFF
jgi:hypothetical protein